MGFERRHPVSGQTRDRQDRTAGKYRRRQEFGNLGDDLLDKALIDPVKFGQGDHPTVDSEKI